MDDRKLGKLRGEVEALRRAPQKASALERIAKKLGRELVKRGKEPMWENKEFDELRSLAIPHHGGKDLPPGTRNSILNQLEDDILAWEKGWMKMMQKTKVKSERSVDPADYLKKPYSRVVVPEEDGSFRAEMQEFPGCIVLANTVAKAYAKLEDTAWSWLEAALEKGQSIPEPMESIGFSGKLVLRLPKSLHKKAARAAEHDGISLNQFIVSSLAEHIGAKSVGSPAKQMAQVVLMPVLTPRTVTGPTQPVLNFYSEYQTLSVLGLNDAPS